MNLSFLDVVFFAYTFISLYMLNFFLVLYFTNKNKMFHYPPGKPEPVSIVMPCFNEGHHIGEAIEALLAMDYPKNMIEIIIVDDKSSDNTGEIAKNIAAQIEKEVIYPGQIKVIVIRENRATGTAF